MESSSFLINFIGFCHKAASIAQIVRKTTSLFDLLIEEKTASQFLDCDYKTFADVLIQESVRYDLSKSFGLGDQLFGEESNMFTNALNSSIKIQVCENEKATKDLILRVLDGHDELAEHLATIIHRDPTEFVSNETRARATSFPTQQPFYMTLMEMWIDPIDATLEYIRGVGLEHSKWATKIASSDAESVRNVTVLLGAYNKETGIPFAGVICQPFCEQLQDGEWSTSCYWGISNGSTSLCSDNIHFNSKTKRILSSWSDMEQLKNRLNEHETSKKWEVYNYAGAGYKFILLLTGFADCYIVSKGSTYKWDTCGPHSILLAVGGGVTDYTLTLKESSEYLSSIGNKNEQELDERIEQIIVANQLTYKTDGLSTCNSNGFIAYTTVGVALSVIKALIR